jgi:hypothetical protein
MHVAENLAFYFAEADAERLSVSIYRVAQPTGACVREEHDLKTDTRTEHLELRRLIAEHESLPHRRIDLDCSGLDEGSREHARTLFLRWT